MSPLWERRRRRADELAARWPEAAEVLRFYGLVLRLQERGEGDPAAYLRLAREEGPPELETSAREVLEGLALQPARVRAAAAWTGPKASASVPARCPHCASQAGLCRGPGGSRGPGGAAAVPHGIARRGADGGPRRRP